jgi:shikimate kinase
MNIYLVGYRGTGKSSLARVLAERLGWSWRDADDLIEQQAGMPIARIFSDQGENAFRDLETEVVRQLVGQDHLVVALGGGAVLRETNRRAIASGCVVWLQAEVETIHDRITADPTTSNRRPNLTVGGGIDEIRRLLAERTPIYAEVADITVTTDGQSLSQIADRVLQGWEGRPS